MPRIRISAKSPKKVGPFSVLVKNASSGEPFTNMNFGGDCNVENGEVVESVISESFKTDDSLQATIVTPENDSAMEKFVVPISHLISSEKVCSFVDPAEVSLSIEITDFQCTPTLLESIEGRFDKLVKVLEDTSIPLIFRSTEMYCFIKNSLLSKASVSKPILEKVIFAINTLAEKIAKAYPTFNLTSKLEVDEILVQVEELISSAIVRTDAFSDSFRVKFAAALKSLKDAIINQHKFLLEKTDEINAALKSKVASVKSSEVIIRYVEILKNTYTNAPSKFTEIFEYVESLARSTIAYAVESKLKAEKTIHDASAKALAALADYKAVQKQKGFALAQQVLSVVMSSTQKALVTAQPLVHSAVERSQPYVAEAVVFSQPYVAKAKPYIEPLTARVVQLKGALEKNKVAAPYVELVVSEAQKAYDNVKSYCFDDIEVEARPVTDELGLE